jgi:FixJ family two-component response regulator
VTQGLQRSRAALEKAIELDELGTRYSTLTIREREVFALVSAGLLNKQIGAELGAAEKTVKQHRGVVMHKMRANSAADLVVMAATLGVRPSPGDFAKSKGIFRASQPTGS